MCVWEKSVSTPKLPGPLQRTQHVEEIWKKFSGDVTPHDVVMANLLIMEDITFFLNLMRYYLHRLTLMVSFPGA